MHMLASLIRWHVTLWSVMSLLGRYKVLHTVLDVGSGAVACPFLTVWPVSHVCWCTRPHHNSHPEHWKSWEWTPLPLLMAVTAVLACTTQ